MAFQFDTELQREAWSVVHAINEAWVNNRAGKIGVHLHPECVMASPDFDQYLRGKEAVVQSYVDYTQQAKTMAFGIANASVDIFGDTAIVNATFVVTYALAGKTYEGGGREVWVLKRANDRWYGVWRSLADMFEEEKK